MEEGVTALPGGPESPEDWARFRVFVEADDSRHITAEESRKIHLFVEFYKNERSHLVEVGYYQRIEASEIVFNTNDWLNVEVTTADVHSRRGLIVDSNKKARIWQKRGLKGAA